MRGWPGGAPELVSVMLGRLSLARLGPPRDREARAPHSLLTRREVHPMIRKLTAAAFIALAGIGSIAAPASAVISWEDNDRR